jgi:predicted signal transduction protein with EAL and GGDEF domain
VQGIVTWDIGYVVASVTCAVVFAAAAMTVLRLPCVTRHRVVLGTALIIVAIATLHFVAMTAMRIQPLVLSDQALGPDQARALALATALIGLVVIASGVFAALIDRQTRSDAMQRLHHMAINDSLTGLPNRVGFQAELARQIGIARTMGARIGLCAIDLDRFKEINDVHGHKAGDDVLALLADRMR